MIRNAKPQVCAFIAMMTVAVGQAGGASTPMSVQETERYREIAHRVFEKIVALRDQYPHLASIQNTTQKEESTDRLWVAYHYTRDLTWIPNPNANPLKKGSQRLKSFSPKDGIELNLYFYEGVWMGQAAVRPVEIGDMNVVSFIEGSDTPSVAAIRNDINQIVADEKSRFTNHIQTQKTWNNTLHQVMAFFTGLGDQSK